MGACQEFLRNLNNHLPELCTVQDLIGIGIYRTPSAAAMARTQQRGPEYFKIPGRGVAYPKAGVLQFLENAIHDNEPVHSSDGDEED